MIAVDAVFVVALAVVLCAVVLYSVVVVRAVAQGGSSLGASLVQRRREVDELGRVAFVLHRVSGFAILAFLALHIVDIGLDSGSHRLYDDVQRLYGSAPLRLFECGLLFAILFHTGNGLRLLALDLVPRTARWSRQALVGVIVLCALAGLAGSLLILRPLVA
ncbi:MAG TPA: succinate dehydrogenase, cytochrome b556 subunit [Gaiellaceae bacterium]|nr:succinate dehydrogenase, cytochrome b556 subunit [Gaiellaceae bacterium]